ncbi:hypothetical protein A2348_00875 [Candidatus Uhrbacteria bacterium RIFOXYB12_FULL_58_10]|uniref:Uncharacterized protein n=1 Tax=Candidatus Uhrbacteria bacterium RIFOXYB2_FULL_57_15 TaxID=1802422 RepID=A0A1F7W6B6_9BACT|nr:MAG: hypothetical protein A2348_00875 [Candidatus Uhrbacteria bacterium RIFOXYB12_FULL_58_10]OGL98341.1 MAG: hypothetical protein A2304_01435 [Candidatus Uhrbacteria bacterium RIFOXYB2_FULL_57_15]
MISRERLATYLQAVLNEPEWRTRMLPPLKIHELTTEEIDAFKSHAREKGIVGRLWKKIVKAIEEDDGTLPEEMTDKGRARRLAWFIASSWVELCDMAKKRGATHFDENYLPSPFAPELADAWNIGALQFGLTGQDFSALVCETLARTQGRGDEVVTW